MKTNPSKGMRSIASQILQECADLEAMAFDLEAEAFNPDLSGEMQTIAMARCLYLNEIARRIKGHAFGLELGAIMVE